jgi:hypothetical protein
MLSIIMIVLTKLRQHGHHMIRGYGYNKAGWPGIVWIHWLAGANFFPLNFVLCRLVSTSSAIVAAILSKDYKYLDWSGIVYMFEGFSYCNLFLNVQLLPRNQQKTKNIINIYKHNKLIHNLSFLPLTISKYD